MKESVAIAKGADAKKGFLPTNNSIHRVQHEPERQIGSLRSVINNIKRDGGMPSVESIATELSGMHTTQRAPVLLALQHTHGNRYVQRVVAGIQAKLKIGQPGDIYEQEADRVADEVMRMSEPQMQRQAEDEEKKKEEVTIQTKHIADQITPLVQRQIEEEEGPLQTKEYNYTPEITTNLEARINTFKSGGQPLPESVRAYFEPRFGYDFSQVRIYTDSYAAEMAHALSAQAFTVGRDVVFGAGQYTLQTLKGKRLLAHELTHVMQQIGENKSSKSAISKFKLNNAWDTNQTKTDSGAVIQRRQSPGIEEEVERMGQEFRRERRRELSRIISRMRFQKVINDCPENTGVRLLDVLSQMRTRVNNNPRCVEFFQGNFGFGPDRLFAPNAPPTIMVDPELDISGRARCPAPSIRIQEPICQSPLRERVLMHELTHYAGCLTRTHTPSSEVLAEQGENICIGTVQEVLEEVRRRRVGGEPHEAQ